MAGTVTYSLNDGDVPSGTSDGTTIVHVEKGVALVRDSTAAANGLWSFNIGGEVWRKLGNGNGIINPEQIGIAQGIDITTQLQDFSNALETGTLPLDNANPTLLLPLTEGEGANLMTLSATISFTASSFQIIGRGEQSTRIRWAGPAGDDMFYLQSPRATYFEGFFLEGSANKPLAGIRIHKISNVGSAPMRGICRNLRIGGFSADLFENCIVFSCDDGQDANNEQWTFYNCLMQSATDNCYWFGHQNSLWHNIIGGSCENFGGAGINSQDVWDNGGSPVSPFAGTPGYIVGMNLLALSGAVCFKMSNSQHQTTVVGCDTEGDARFLTMTDSAPPATDTGKVSFIGGSYKMGSEAGLGGPQVDCVGTDTTINFDGCHMLSGDGVGFKADGSKMVMNLTNLSGNPRAFEPINGAVINLNAGTINSGSDFVYRTPTNGGVLRYTGPARSTSAQIQVDQSLQCTNFEFISVDPAGNDLDTVITEKDETGDELNLHFLAPTTIVTGGNIGVAPSVSVSAGQVITLYKGPGADWVVNQ